MTSRRWLPLLLVTLVCASTGVLRGCQAVVIGLNWTTQGVMEYSTEPLKVRFGDTVNLVCNDTMFSNLIYVAGKEQYDDCDSRKGNGRAIDSGQCLPDHGTIVSLMIERPSSNQNNGRVIYEPGMQYYFYSSSNGDFLSTVSGSPYVGGQCEDGLKMILAVVDTHETKTAVMPQGTPTGKPGTGGSSRNNGDNSSQSFPLTTIIGAVAGGAVIIILALTVIIITAFCVGRHLRKKKCRSVAVSTNGTALITTGDEKLENGTTFGQREDVVEIQKNESYGIVLGDGESQSVSYKPVSQTPSAPPAQGNASSSNGRRAAPMTPAAGLKPKTPTVPVGRGGATSGPTTGNRRGTAPTRPPNEPPRPKDKAAAGPSHSSNSRSGSTSGPRGNSNIRGAKGSTRGGDGQASTSPPANTSQTVRSPVRQAPTADPAAIQRKRDKLSIGNFASGGGY